MKTCENCKRVFQDDMSFCPYCGTKVHDYKDDLKAAMADLFEEEVAEEKPTLSRVKKQELLKEEKTNELLNKLLTVLIVLIVGTLLVGGIMLGEKFLPKQPGIVEDTNSTDENQNTNNDDQVVSGDKNEETVISGQNDGEVINITNDESSKFQIESVLAKMEEGQVKLEITCNAELKGEVYLKDVSTLNIGPIQIREGNNQFYFLINGQTNYKLCFVVDDETYEYEITQAMIEEAFN